MHFDIEWAKQSFLAKAFLTAIPIVGFSLYITYKFYGLGLTFIVGWFLWFFIFSLLLGIFGRHRPALDGSRTMYLMLLFPYVALAAQGSWKELLVSPITALPVIAMIIIYYTSKISWLTGKGLRAYKKLLGYKKFVERVEVPKLEYILKEHPKHVDKSLPYALLFNLMKHDLQSELK